MRRVDEMPRGSGRATRGFLLVVILASSLGCGGRAATPLRIAAASDLQSALPELADRFQARTGIKLSNSFGASGHLSEQINGGAPFDMFLAADLAFVNKLAKEGLIDPESVHPYARGSLVMAVYHEVAGEVQSLHDLTKPVVRKIALANPATAPYGKAGKEALKRAGVWAEVEPKIVIAESVRQALYYAQKGDAEAALVGRAIAGVPETRAVEIDEELHDPIIQALGIVRATGRRADAERFSRFVLDEEGQSILRKFGFAPAGPAAAARQLNEAPATK